MAEQSVRLFSLGSSVDGEPRFIQPASFKALGAQELKDIERWIKREPELLGEEVLILSSQFSKWDKTSDRPDLLGLDRRGKLVVVDQAGQLGQGPGPAGDSLRLVRLHPQLRRHHRAAPPSTQGARRRAVSRRFQGTTRRLRRDGRNRRPGRRRQAPDHPRLVGFPARGNEHRPLARTFALDVACVQIQPYELRGEIVLTSTAWSPCPRRPTSR